MDRLNQRVDKTLRSNPQKGNEPNFRCTLELSDFLGFPPDPDKDPAVAEMSTKIGFTSARNFFKKLATQLAMNYREECNGGSPRPYSLNCIFAGMSFIFE